MSWSVEFGTKAEADEVREQYDSIICPVDDDRRLKSVSFISDVDDETRQTLETRAAASRGDREAGPGQVALSDGERDRLGFSRDGVNVPKYRAIKGVATEAGVDDWLAFADAELTVDEHREVMDRAAREERGDRLDAEESDAQRAQRLAAQQASGECDHARGACEHGDPEACEFLSDHCGLPDEEVDALLADGDTVPFDSLDGEVKGAYGRAWQGYKVGVRRLSGLLEDIGEELRQTEQAAGALRSLEDGISDRDTDELEALRSHHETLRSLARRHSDTDHGQQGSDEASDEDLAAREPAPPAQSIAEGER